MEWDCYLVARKKANYTVGVEVCTYHVLNLIVIGQYTIDLLETNQSVYGFLILMTYYFFLTGVFVPLV